MSIELPIKSFLGADVKSFPKVQYEKIAEIITAVNDLTDGSISSTNLTLSGTLGVSGISTLGATTPVAISAAGVLTSASTTNATTKDTGAIITEGGIGVEKAVFAGGKITTSDTTASTTSTTGSLIAGGGAGIAGAIFAGTTINAGTTLSAGTAIILPDGTVGALALRLGADENNGLYGISDTQMGFAVEGTLVGGANTLGLFTDVIAEQTATVGVTVDGLLIKDGGASANSMFAGFFPTTAAQSLSGPGAVTVTQYLTKYTSTGVADALTIASGSQIGQRKKVQHTVDGGSAVLTGVFVGGTTITFTAVAEFADLIWTGASWAVLELGNTAAPGTPPVLA